MLIPIHIRWLIRRDMPEVLAIEEDAFGCPWTEEDFVRVLRERNCISKVAEHQERVAGYMVYRLQQTTIELLNVAVDPTRQRCGIGRQMIQRLRLKLSQQRRRQIVTEVCEGNLTAHLFLRAMGFKATEVLRGFYLRDETADSAYRFVYRLPALSGPQATVPENRISNFIDCGG